MIRDSESDDYMTVEDALKLKAAIESSITWRGANATEALELSNMTPGHREQALALYDELYRKRYRCARWLGVLSTVGILGLVCALVPRFSAISVVIIGAVLQLAFWVTVRQSKRDAHSEGYLDGYEAGFETGAFHALGISPDDLPKVTELDHELKLNAIYLSSAKNRTREQESD